MRGLGFIACQKYRSPGRVIASHDKITFGFKSLFIQPMTELLFVFRSILGWKYPEKRMAAMERAGISVK